MREYAASEAGSQRDLTPARPCLIGATMSAVVTRTQRRSILAVVAVAVLVIAVALNLSDQDSLTDSGRTG